MDKAHPELVRMEAIDKRFPGVHALRAVDFDLRAGEVHALMGENGAGKSTLMKCLSGVDQPDSGRILVGQQEVTLPSPKAAQDLGIGIIHQELALMKDLNVAQNIWIGREPRRSLGRIRSSASVHAPGPIRRATIGAAQSGPRSTCWKNRCKRR